MFNVLFGSFTLFERFLITFTFSLLSLATQKHYVFHEAVQPSVKQFFDRYSFL